MASVGGRWTRPAAREGLDGLGGESPTKPLEDEGKAEGKDGSGGGGGGDGGDGNPGEQPGRGAATAMPATPRAQSAAGSAVKDGDDMLLDGDGGGVAGKGGKDGGEGGEEKGSDATIVPLFRFQCEGTEGRTVTSQAWNKVVNGDILGVGYGDFTFAQSATSNAAAVAAAATDSGEGNKQTSSEVNNSSSSSNILGVEEKEEGGAGADRKPGRVWCSAGPCATPVPGAPDPDDERGHEPRLQHPAAQSPRGGHVRRHRGHLQPQERPR